ncbi:hypothetical protein B566_EDAN004043, partial [Ephemera danica]
MARKRKGRATRRNRQSGDSEEPDELKKAPHSFVITRGNISGYVQELAKDFRKIMEPFTASSLKSRKKNTLKDFVSVAGPLHVSHLCSFSQTELGVYLRVARLPRGPTLTLRVHTYCLSRDVLSSIKKPVATSKLFNNSPLVVLNSFSGEGMHLKLLATTFQNMFPSINITKVNLSTIRRCVLLSYDPETKLIDLRHYAIRAVPIGLSKSVKKLVQAKIPDLSRFTDVSEFIMKDGQMSESEAEDDPASHVELPQELPSRGNMAAAKSAVRLVELGPRLTLQYVHKTEEEKKAISKKRNQKIQLKATRRKQQEENAQRKLTVREEHKQRSLQGHSQNENAEEERDDDAEWYRTEVGQEPDNDLFDSNAVGKKRKVQHQGREKPLKKVKFSDDRPNNKRQPKEFASHNKKFKSSSTGGFKARGRSGENGSPKSHFKRTGNSRSTGKRIAGKTSFQPFKRQGTFSKARK